MSVRGQGLFSGGIYNVGYWNDSYFTIRPMMIGAVNTPVAAAQATSLVINDLDDGTGGGVGLFSGDDALGAGGGLIGGFDIPDDLNRNI